MIVYKNTKTTLPGWANTIHEGQPLGYAYECPEHFVHLYGKDSGWWVISPGLTVTQKKVGTLEEWALNTFGAEDMRKMFGIPGRSIASVWRPGMLFADEIQQGLKYSDSEKHSFRQALRLLLERLDDLLLYIEPDVSGLVSYSHKTRELLLLACTELENSWKHYMALSGVTPQAQNYTTNDYVRLRKPLHLSDYEIRLRPFAALDPVKPFKDWDPARPTASIPWYDAYNKTKHDRTTHFSGATLRNCIDAVIANVVMYCVRFSPYSLFQGGGSVESISSQLLEFGLRDPDPRTFYVPRIEPKSDHRPDLICFNCSEIRIDWNDKPPSV